MIFRIDRLVRAAMWFEDMMVERCAMGRFGETTVWRRYSTALHCCVVVSVQNRQLSQSHLHSLGGRRMNL